jgi:hypothetical protein
MFGTRSSVVSAEESIWNWGEMVHVDEYIWNWELECKYWHKCFELVVKGLLLSTVFSNWELKDKC